MSDTTFRFYQIYNNAQLPSYATEQAACFDIRAHLIDAQGITRHLQGVNEVGSSHYEFATALDGGAVYVIKPGYTMLIPTGLIAVMPNNYSLRIHLRSSMALKRGLYLPNGEGVIDSDYFEELYMMVKNGSKTDVEIVHGERICQGEWVPVTQFPITSIHTRPQKSTNREGGFGSTGA